MKEQKKFFLSPQERRQRNREEMKNAILEAARQVMREEGVAALNLQEVARRVGVRAPSLYECFPGKMALYDALFRMGVRLYAERMNHFTESTDSFWERAQDGLENYMAFAQQYPELYQLVQERPVPGFVPSEESMEQSRRLLTMTDAIVEKGIERGSVALVITVAQARAIPPLSHREAMGMARLELERFLALVTSLSEDEWEKPTACPLWNVRQILAHVTGAAASYARWSEFKRQNSLKVQRPYRASGLSFLESLNQIPADYRACSTPAPLIDQLQTVD